MTTEPPVWRHLTQSALDAGYSQVTHAPNMMEVINRYESDSRLARQRLGEPVRHRYGSTDIEALDRFGPSSTVDAPILIFLHGGAWQEGRASNYAFVAEPFVAAGIQVLVPDFSWVQDVGRSLFPIADQLRNVIAWTHEHASGFGADPARIHVAGHSSGGHLAAVLLTTDWAEVGLPGDVIAGGLCCSGIFDLEPVRLSHRGSYIDFTDEMVHALSPQRQLRHLSGPLIVAHGGDETPEFIRQSQEFAASATSEGHDIDLIVRDGHNHFEVLETLADPGDVLHQAMLDQIMGTA